MVDWDLYEILLGNGNSESDARQTAIDGAVSVFVEGIVDDPAYQANALINGEITPIIASRKSTIECSIKAVPGTSLHIGDMVECYDQQWIVVELYVDKVGVINGVMWLCNDSIRFQNHSPVVHTRYCVVDDGTYSKKSSDPDAFVMANTYKIYITTDEATERIFVDKRLGFGSIYSPSGEKILEVYKVIGMDLKSKNYGEGSHLMVLTAQRDVYNAETDDIHENICDIFKESETTSAPSTSGSCFVNGRDSVRIGTVRKYTAVYTDANNEPVSGVTTIWAVSAPSGVICSKSDQTCSIEVPLDSNLVGEIITIRVSDEDGRFGSYEKKVQVVTVG